jgi:hypothetical protein
MAAARESDQRDLISCLDKLAENDQDILEALQRDEDRLRRLEELVTAFTKVS